MTRRVARLLALVVGGLLGWALVVACTVEEFAAPEHARLGANYVTSALTVNWRATCGTISSGGLYTAPSTTPSGGKCLVIATRTDNGLGRVDTADAFVASATVTRGRSYGPFGLWAGCTLTWGPGPFTLSQNFSDPSTIVAQIGCARTKGQRLILAMTGGSHTNYLTNGVFDLAKWTARMDKFRTAAIQAAIRDGVADGTILGAALLDEPNHASWGGSLTKPLLDQMATYAKAINPTLPVGVNNGPVGFRWRATERYRVVDYVLNQYNFFVTKGNVVAWRDSVLMQARRDSVAVAFSLNVLDGGVVDKDGVWDCWGIGLGTYSPACPMSATQVRDYGRALGPAGCFLLSWQVRADYFARADVQSAFAELASLMAQQPATRCGRP